MHLTSPSLFAAIWLTSTALALVARPSSLHPRADTTLQYPPGYNAQTCPSEASNLILTAHPAMTEAVLLPASAPAPPNSALTARGPPQPNPAVFCRLIYRLRYTGADYARSFDRRTLEVGTPLLQPGVYSVAVTGTRTVHALSIAQTFVLAPLYASLPWNNVVRDNPSLGLGSGFVLQRPAYVYFRITFWGPDTSGGVALFQLQQPGAWQAAMARAGLPVSAPAAPDSALTRRVPPPAAPAESCRTISRTSFTGDDYLHSYNGRTLEIQTELLHPGQYVIAVTGNRVVRGLAIAKMELADVFVRPTFHDIIQDNPTLSLATRMQLDGPTIVHMRITFWGPNTAGRVGLFQVEPSGAQAASARVGTFDIECPRPGSSTDPRPWKA